MTGASAFAPRGAGPFETQVFRLAMSGPSDMSALRQLFDAGALDPSHVAAVIGKTEGNGGVNDFTRGYFTQSLMILLAERLGVTVEEASVRTPCMLSGGTEGVLSPHMSIFARVPSRKPPDRPALAIGVAFAEEVPAEAVGRMAHMRATTAAVELAMADAVLSAEEVEFVQVKAPGLTSARMADARAARRRAGVDRHEPGDGAVALGGGARGRHCARRHFPRPRERTRHRQRHEPVFVAG